MITCNEYGTEQAREYLVWQLAFLRAQQERRQQASRASFASKIRIRRSRLHHTMSYVAVDKRNDRTRNKTNRQTADIQASQVSEWSIF
jgi:hypothetical protein